MTPKYAVTPKEMLKFGSIVAEAKEPRLFRTDHYLPDILGCKPHADNDNIRLSIYVAQRANNGPYLNKRQAFGYNCMGALGSMTVEMLVRGYAGSPSSLMLDMRDEWPALYARAVDSELAAKLEKGASTDNLEYEKIFDTLFNMRKHKLVTWEDATSTVGQRYYFSDADRSKIITI